MGMGRKPFMDIQHSDAAICDRAVSCGPPGRSKEPHTQNASLRQSCSVFSLKYFLQMSYFTEIVLNSSSILLMIFNKSTGWKFSGFTETSGSHLTMFLPSFITFYSAN